MTKQETLQRIEKEANLYAMNHSAAPDKETPDWIKMDFIAGAKSERNRVLDEAIDKINKGIPVQCSIEARRLLESLKIR